MGSKRDEVEFTGWHMVRQEAVDKHGNVWKVGGWYGRHGVELPMIFNDWDNGPWADVEYVTVFFDTADRRMWSTLHPDDFTGSTN